MAQASSGKSASFGGRKDMISSSFDEVRRNQIWRELLGREGKQLKINDQFHLDPTTLDPVAAKPTEVKPSDFDVKNMEQVEEDNYELAQDLKEKIAAHGRPPTGKYEYPLTESQEVGWLSEQLGAEQVKRTSRWHAPLSTCQETRYAQAYVATFNKNPFAVRGKGGSGK